MWTKAPDGSIIDDAGKVIFFSTQRFVEDICLGDCCFICGARPGEKHFNDEHVIPEWLLRRYQLFDRTLNLANGQTVRYDRLTTPCCAECNSLMGELIEEPMSAIVRGGHTAFNDYVVNGRLLNVFVWLGLVFLKLHLKDRTYRWHRDARKGDQRISDFHTWADLHHVHCLVRSFYNDTFVEREAVGSFLTVPMRDEPPGVRFDFADLSEAQTIMLRLDDFAVFAVFNDSGGAMNWFHQKYERIKGPLSALQAREVMTDLAFLNLHLEPRPSFHTETNIPAQISRIIAHRSPDAPEMAPFDYNVRGALLETAIGYAIPNIRVAGETSEQVSAAIKAGNFTCLFDTDGTFLGPPFAEGEAPADE